VFVAGDNELGRQVALKEVLAEKARPFVTITAAKLTCSTELLTTN
jgi:hypothetical protein